MGHLEYRKSRVGGASACERAPQVQETTDGETYEPPGAMLRRVLGPTDHLDTRESKDKFRNLRNYSSESPYRCISGTNSTLNLVSRLTPDSAEICSGGGDNLRNPL